MICKRCKAAPADERYGDPQYRICGTCHDECVAESRRTGRPVRYWRDGKGWTDQELVWTDEDTRRCEEAKEANRRLGGLRYATSYEEIKAMMDDIQAGGPEVAERYEREMRRETLTNLVIPNAG